MGCTTGKAEACSCDALAAVPLFDPLSKPVPIRALFRWRLLPASTVLPRRVDVLQAAPRRQWSNQDNGGHVCSAGESEVDTQIPSMGLAETKNALRTQQAECVLRSR